MTKRARRTASVEALVATLTEHVRHTHPPHRLSDDQPACRDAHPKHHGCVRATFRVGDTLDPRLKEVLGPHGCGVFVPGQEYDAWVRFSNALGVRHDLFLDARGMAIKLLAVGSTAGAEQTQDFLLVTHPTFFTRDDREFVDVPAAVMPIAASNKGVGGSFIPVLSCFIGLRPPRFRWRGLLALRGTLKWTSNPLFLTYFSQVPLGMGRDPRGNWEAVKFRAKPRQGIALLQRLLFSIRALLFQFGVNGSSDQSSKDFLQKALYDYLAARPAAFDFGIQLRTDRRSMPLDDATKKWKTWRLLPWGGPASPFVTIGVVSIGRDEHYARSEKREELQAFGQHLSYTPWHAVPEHRPLGSINRARRTVYEAVSRLRHDLNRRCRREPHRGETPRDYLVVIESTSSQEETACAPADA